MATILTRYGHSETIDDENNEWVTHQLIRELRTEQFEEPDDEHTQVSVGNEHWTVTAQVSGLITFDNMDLIEGRESDLPEDLYLRNIDDEELVEIWQAIVRNEKESLMSHNWKDFDSLEPYISDYYRSTT